MQAIVGARIEIGDGRVIEKGNLVIRDGLIVAVGPDASVPPGAEVLDGKGLTLFPGLINSFTNSGVKPPAADPNQDASPPTSDYAPAFMREANRKGVRPELQARQYLTLTDDVARPYRNVGFTTLMIAPGGGYLNGIGTLANLSGRPARDAVVSPRTMLAMTFGGGFGFGGGYPASLLGRISHVRQAFVDAQGYRATTQAFQAGGAQRPPSDMTLEALLPALDRSLPTGIEADTTSQIDRALNFAAELHLRPILVGGLQAYRRIDQIKASGAPVLLSLNFGPEPVAPKPPDPKTPPKTADDPGDAPVPELPERIAERSRLYQETVKNADALRQAGIPFALTDRGCKDPKEFIGFLRAAVKNGLPRDVALRALTLDAAKIFGVERQLGTLEVGKTANVVAMTADFLDEKTKVKMLYIDGHKIDPEAKPVGTTPRNRFGGEVGR
ncbi:hypothetical protein OP10G_1585 [Fimbriimonas ginsengisoli Gsoil 348]|uniref:Amidohydrolase-related domain-containing protein n=1 Tax=Fimbriimonas ginsengisoli Gsoil 348 TaxID=661478 RepID=A0A068NN16_FIMGI|nr:hypothetical protein OP10G_1585 [Fimbriimonas ginsengisoli Gsoil 348]